MKNFFTYILPLVILISCSNNEFKIINKKNIKFTFISNSSSTFKGYYYLGSDPKFHFFVSKWDYEKDTQFKLKKSDLVILFPHKYGEKEIRIEISKTPNLKTFTKDEDFKLYVQ